VKPIAIREYLLVNVGWYNYTLYVRRIGRYWVVQQGFRPLTLRNGFMDDGETIPEDASTLSPGEMITVNHGGLFYQGQSSEPYEIPGILTKSQVTAAIKDRYRLSYSLPAAIRRWLKCQKTLTICVEIDREKEAEFRAALKALGGKVIE